MLIEAGPARDIRARPIRPHARSVRVAARFSERLKLLSQMLEFLVLRPCGGCRRCTGDTLAAIVRAAFWSITACMACERR